MARLIYSAISSLDGYVADEDGNFDWAVPDEEVHAFINDLTRPFGTYLYGRRLYETMVGWETAHTLADQSPLTRDFAQIWQAAKIVYSKTLDTASSARTRIIHHRGLRVRPAARPRAAPSIATSRSETANGSRAPTTRPYPALSSRKETTPAPATTSGTAPIRTNNMVLACARSTTTSSPGLWPL
jgi:hypothetical protein